MAPVTNNRTRALLSAAVACSLTILVLLSTRSTLDRRKRTDDWVDRVTASASAGRQLVCNPYSQPGFLNWDRAKDQYAAPWISLNADCPTGENWFEVIRKAIEDLGQRPPPPPATGDDPHADLRAKFDVQDRSYESLWWLRNKTILFMGDSVDRNGLNHMAWLAWSEYGPTSYSDATSVAAPEGWDERGVPHIVRITKLGVTLVNVFFYGVDDDDTFQWQVDWHAPGKFEDRMAQLFVPFMDQLGTKPDFIQLHSGMWDMALFARKDLAAERSTEDPFTLEQLEWWKRRMLSIVRDIQVAWPEAALWVRQIHRIGDFQAWSSIDYTVGMHAIPAEPNFFPNNRIHQLRHATSALGRQLCLPINDFGERWEGFQAFQDKVHPLPLPGGMAYGDAILEFVRMESLGRGNWLEKPCSS